MSLWILDTDHTSLFLAGNSSIISQVAEHSNDIAITIITVQELFNPHFANAISRVKEHKYAHSVE